MSSTELAEWRAYLNAWPSGEEALDMRFEALRVDLVNGLANLYYITGVAGGVKPSPKQPQMMNMTDAKIFNRLGQVNTPKGGKYYDEMTQEQINKRMRAFSVDLRSKGSQT